SCSHPGKLRYSLVSWRSTHWNAAAKAVAFVDDRDGFEGCWHRQRTFPRMLPAAFRSQRGRGDLSWKRRAARQAARCVALHVHGSLGITAALQFVGSFNENGCATPARFNQDERLSLRFSRRVSRRGAGRCVLVLSILAPFLHVGCALSPRLTSVSR